MTFEEFWELWEPAVLDGLDDATLEVLGTQHGWEDGDLHDLIPTLKLQAKKIWDRHNT